MACVLCAANKTIYMKTFYPFALMLLSTVKLSAQNNQHQYTKVPTGYVMVLTQGDSLFPALERLAVLENIPSASFSAIGFVHIRFGFFRFSRKKYKSRTFKNMELASLNGSLAWKDGKPSLHAHGVAASNRFKTRGGHILGAVVSTGSLEITITVHDKKLWRKKNEQLGADVLTIQE